LLAGCTTVDGRTPEQVLMVAAALEARSEHPLARALVAAAPAAGPVVEDARQTAGEGVTARIDGVEVRVGRPEFVALLAGAMPPALMEFAGGRADTLVGLGDERGWHALFALSDALRPGAGRLIADLKALSITPVLVSGDRNASVDAVARTLGIDDAHAQMRPEDKRDRIAALQCTGAVVAMVGDGINDAPALAQAQVSLSLGSAVPLAQWTADAVILSDRIELVAVILHEARRTFRIIRQNLAWALAYNTIAVPAAALGFVTPLLAAVGMSGSSLFVVGNALRLTRPARERTPAPIDDRVAGGVRALESAWKS